MTVLRAPTTSGQPNERVDNLHQIDRRRRTLAWIGGLTTVLVVTLPVGVGVGPVPISPWIVTRIFGHHLLDWPHTVSWSTAQDSIVWQVRAPRVILGAIVGAGLAVTGVALQALVRNVLADPFLLGVSSGASTGAVATILFGVGAGIGASALTASAFAGALAATGLVLVIARVSGRVTSTRLLLAGVAVGYALAAVTSFLIFASGARDGAQVQDLYSDQEFLGSVFDTGQKANQSAADLKKRVDAVQAAKPAGNRTTAAAIYFLGDKVYTYGEKAMVTDEMKVLGLTNLLAKVDQSVELNRESLIAANPDVIIVIYGYETGDTFDKAKQHLLDLPGAGGMSAVKNNALVEVTGPEAEASPIAVDGIEMMARELAGSK
ncbi:MAG: iron chelate uptake ABC transporter family permease subunit [Pseudonocardiaceae bacterium]